MRSRSTDRSARGPIHVKKEIPGHAVNHIQAALYRGFDGRSIDELAARRDAILCALLSARAQHTAGS
jgi:hypothetical protein